MEYNVNISENQKNKCNEIIHSHSEICRGLGNWLGRIPLADSAIIIPIQTAMIIKLAMVFDQRIDDRTAQSIIASSSNCSSFLDRAAFHRLFCWGTGIRNTISATNASKSTKRIGWRAADRLSRERFDDADIDEDGSSSVHWHTYEVVHKFRKNEIRLVSVKIDSGDSNQKSDNGETN